MKAYKLSIYEIVNSVCSSFEHVQNLNIERW